MARIRTIKPEFWEDEKIASLDMESRLLFIGSWNFADDFGVFPDSAKWLRIKIFPYDSLCDNDVTTRVDALIKNQFLFRFKHDEKSYLVIRQFRSHQIIDKRYERSILDDSGLEKLAKAMVSKKTTQGTRSENNVTTPPDRIGEEGNGNGKEGKASPEILKVIFPFDSENFRNQWTIWKDYKLKEKKFKYATAQSEQAALEKLAKLSDGDEVKAISIIHESLANGWSGFFAIKQEQKNGKKPTGDQVSDFDLASKIAKHYSKAGV